jgi:hypothetical protein
MRDWTRIPFHGGCKYVTTDYAVIGLYPPDQLEASCEEWISPSLPGYTFETAEAAMTAIDTLFPVSLADRLFEELDEFDDGSGTLDDLIHQVTSEVASAVNNAGLEEQIRYLLDNGVDEATIRRTVIEQVDRGHDDDDDDGDDFL